MGRRECSLLRGSSCLAARAQVLRLLVEQQTAACRWSGAQRSSMWGLPPFCTRSPRPRRGFPWA